MSNLTNFKHPIVIMAFLGLVVGLLLLFMARHQSFMSGENLHPLGVVGEVIEDVRVKRQGNMHWYMAHKNQDLYQGDLVFTGDKAKTSLQLKDHGELILGDYTMVIIHPGFIQVESGEIELKALRDTTIKMLGERVRVSAKSSTSVINRSDEKKIKFSGNDEVRPENRKIQEVLNKASLVNQKGMEFVEAPATKIKARELTKLKIFGLKAIWEPKKEAMKLVFESLERFDNVKVVFKKGSLEKQFEGTQSIDLKDLPRGKYKVNAIGFLGEEVVSKSKEFEVEVFIPLRLPELGAPKLKKARDKISF